MDRLSITTHLIAVITAFSAFTMPIALEVINRIKSRYRSAYYMDTLEEIMGFKIRSLFGQLIITLILLLFFSLVVSALPTAQFPESYILTIEYIFLIVTGILLVKEFHFIKTIFLATRSDNMVTDYLINKIKADANKEGRYPKEVDLLVQIACYNVEHTETTLGEKSIDRRLFEFIESAYKGESKNVSTNTIEDLLSGLSSMLAAVRNVDKRDKYVYLQREYGKHLIQFYDHQKNSDEIFSKAMSGLYEASILEINSNYFWLLRADFLISINTWEIKKPNTIKVIDRHIRRLIEFLAYEKPELIADVLDNYRNLHNYDSYLDSNIYSLSDIGGEYSTFGFDDIHTFVKKHEHLLISSPKEYISQLILLIDKVTQEKRKTLDKYTVQHQRLATDAAKFEEEISHEAIKKIGNLYSERSAIEAIRTLALHKEWHCILDCYNSTSPAHSRTMRVGHKLLAANIDSFIDQLGQSDYAGIFERESINHAYMKVIPLLLMLSIYNWRQRNYSTDMDEAVKQLSTSLKLKERTISKAKAVEKDMGEIIYFAGSPSYSQSLCTYFGIEHEQEAFKGASLKLLTEMKLFLREEQETLKRTQPLSEEIKLRFSKEVRDDTSRLINDYPLLHKYQTTSSKRETYQRFVFEDSRDAFLDNTGTHHIFNGLSRLGLIHSKLAYTLIKTKGKTISNLQLDNLKPSEILFITPKDWESATASLDLSKIKNINKKLIFTDSPLHKAYIHDTNKAGPYVTVYNPEETNTSIENTYQNALELEFIDEETKVTVNLDYHIYLNDEV